MNSNKELAYFPAFTGLTIKQKKRIDHITSKFEPYSDFNFTSLFCWRGNGRAGLSLLNDNLVIRLPDYITGKSVYSILGDNKIEASVDTLLGKVTKLHLVPEVVINKIENQQKYVITEDRDNFDYIYSVSSLHSLEGVKYKNIRNKHNNFVAAHKLQELETVVVDKLDAEQRELIREIDRQWAVDSSRDQGDILAERNALGTMLNHAADLDVFVVFVLVDGKIMAFSINELLPNNYSVCHFEKALKTHHINIYPFLVRKVAGHLKQIGYEWCNWEQDLGLSGLRHSKMSYHPATFLKKYTISKNPSG